MTSAPSCASVISPALHTWHGPALLGEESNSDPFCSDGVAFESGSDAVDGKVQRSGTAQAASSCQWHRASAAVVAHATCWPRLGVLTIPRWCRANNWPRTCGRSRTARLAQLYRGARLSQTIECGMRCIAPPKRRRGLPMQLLIGTQPQHAAYSFMAKTPSWAMLRRAFHRPEASVWPSLR
jgi:hypothetical protein